MKKILIPFVAVVSAGALFSCGPGAAEKAQQDSIRVADSLHRADSLRVADSIRIADSLKTADSLKAAEAEKAAAAAKSAAAAKAIAEYRKCVEAMPQWISSGVPTTSARAFSKIERDDAAETKCERLIKDMTPEQKAEFNALKKQYERLAKKWDDQTCRMLDAL